MRADRIALVVLGVIALAACAYYGWVAWSIGATPMASNFTLVVIVILWGSGELIAAISSAAIWRAEAEEAHCIYRVTTAKDKDRRDWADLEISALKTENKDLKAGLAKASDRAVNWVRQVKKLKATVLHQERRIANLEAKNKRMATFAASRDQFLAYDRMVDRFRGLAQADQTALRALVVTAQYWAKEARTARVRARKAERLTYILQQGMSEDTAFASLSQRTKSYSAAYYTMIKRDGDGKPWEGTIHVADPKLLARVMAVLHDAPGFGVTGKVPGPGQIIAMNMPSNVKDTLVPQDANVQQLAWDLGRAVTAKHEGTDALSEFIDFYGLGDREFKCLVYVVTNEEHADALATWVAAAGNTPSCRAEGQVG